MKKGHRKKEHLLNVANVITLSRIFITFFLVYAILLGYSLIIIAVIFALGALTDYLDGYFARKFQTLTEFGRKFDMIADRFLMLGVVLAFLIKFSTMKVLIPWYIFQIILVVLREIIALPFALIAMIFKKGIPHARFIGKATTFLQGVSFPLLLLNMAYPAYQFSIYASLLTGIVGFVSGICYIKDIQR